jgi:peroxiredoxin
VAKHPEAAVHLVLGDIKRLRASDIVAGAPKAGEKLQNFFLSNHHSERRSLAQLREKGPVVVTFVVDVDGTITFADVDADFTVRAEPTTIVQELNALVQ